REPDAIQRHTPQPLHQVGQRSDRRFLGGDAQHRNLVNQGFFGSSFFFSKTMMCCQGSVLIVSVCLSGKIDISLMTWRSLILWTSLIGTLGSSMRNSTNTSRPPGFSALSS